MAVTEKLYSQSLNIVTGTHVRACSDILPSAHQADSLEVLLAL